MAKAFGEWLRDNPDGTRAEHEEYLRQLAVAAQAANEPRGTLTGPEAVITRALAGYDAVPEDMTRDAMAALKAAGYVIAPAHQGTTRVYTREQVSAAVNGAADILPDPGYESEETIARDDTVNLVVNAALYLLDHPGADADEVIAAQYTDVDLHEDDLDEDEEMPERGSARWNELVVARVLGWVET